MPKIKSALSHIPNAFSHVPKIISKAEEVGKVGQEALRCAAGGLAFGGKVVHQVLGSLKEFMKAYEKYKHTKNPAEKQEVEEFFEGVKNLLQLADEAAVFAMNVGVDLQGKNHTNAASDSSNKHSIQSSEVPMITT